MQKIKILQLTTIERNLAGVCYYPYWIYVALKEKDSNYPITFYENTTMRDIENIFDNSDEDDLFLIDLSSYPQIEFAQAIFRDYKYKHNIKFIGYDPLIKDLNLPYISNKELGINILDGVFNYIFYKDHFKYLLLNDCDNHIKSIDPRQVVPVFLSVGCNRGCSFCYVGVSQYPNGSCTLDQAKKIIDYCEENNLNIHFSDENFYYHKNINEILEYLKGKNIKWICLTDTIMLDKKIKELGEDYLLECGSFLNEVGLETADDSNIDKKQKLDNLINSKLNIFWLTVTFMPNETITTLNNTGKFLDKEGVGYKKDQLLRRVVTNSTVGGLGQFYQSYHGTLYSKDINSLGKVYTDQPTRLWPSFVGYKFLNEIPTIKRKITPEDIQWFDLYSTKEKVLEVFNKVNNINSIVGICGDNLEEIIIMAQLAKLNIIKSEDII